MHDAYPPAVPTALSDTELEILRLVATGATNREIAHVRTISEATVKKHLTNINGKLGTANRTEAMRRALDMGLIALGEPAAGGAAADGEAVRADDGVAARLAAELSRTRRRARRAVALTLGGALLTVAVVAGAATYQVNRAAPPPTAAPPTAVAQPASWVLGRQLPAPRTGLAAVAAGADLYVVGGAGEGGRLISQTLRYAGAGALDWQPRAPKPTAVRDIGAAVVQGRIIVPGGCGADGRAVETVEIYDPRTDAWTAGAPLPSGRAVCGYAIAALDGQVYVFGGRAATGAAAASDAVLRYDPGADSWTVEPDRLLRPRADLAAAAFDDRDRIHLVGGRSPGGQVERNHWVYRPFAAAAERWDESVAPLPEGRAGHAMAAATSPGEHLYLVGGGFDRHLETGTLSFDVEAGAWAPFAVVRGYTPDRGAALAVLGRHQLVLVGGQRLTGEPLRQTYVRPLKYEILLPTGGQR